QRLQLCVSLGKTESFAHLDCRIFAHYYFLKMIQALSSWMLIIARQLFSSLAIDFQTDLSPNCN
ncbi:hypothetical protein NVV43_25975, partial [Escherichia marmotae]|nr:hypothetical protein [Escherichia marmotae]